VKLCVNCSGSSNNDIPPVVNPAALEKNAFPKISKLVSSLGNTYRYGIVPNNDSKNRLEKTRIDACCKFKLDFSP
jgi:hypothetical protein